MYLVMSPQQQFTISMNFLNVRERLEEVLVQFFLPQSIDLPNTEQTNPISDSTIGRRIFRHTVMENIPFTSWLESW